MEKIQAKCHMCNSTKVGPSVETYILKEFVQTEGDKDQGIETDMGMKVRVMFCADCKCVMLQSVGKIEKRDRV